jgi:hypothetical protein
MSHLRDHEDDIAALEAEVLRHARALAPPPDAAARTLSALGLGPSAALGATGAAVATRASMALLAKWVSVGALSGVLVIGASHGRNVLLGKTEVVRPAPEPLGGHAPAPTVARGAELAAPALPPPVETPAASERAVLPRPPQLGAERRAANAAPVVAPSGGQSPLDAELALLDAARAAVASRDPDRALRLLDQHRRDFPNGQLAEEATYVRVKALVERGDRRQADIVARKFLEAFPASPHAKRIRALLQTDVHNP